MAIGALMLATTAPALTVHVAPAAADPVAEQAPSTGCDTDEAPAKLENYIRGSEGRVMTRLSCNERMAVYAAPEILKLDKARTSWAPGFVDDLWEYHKNTYGECVTTPVLKLPIGSTCKKFGDNEKPLMLFLDPYQDGAASGAIATRFDEFSGYRDTVSGESGVWSDRDIMSDILVHESCHLVEGAGQGIHESPSFAVWGDSQWAPYCQFDFYQNTNSTAGAERIFDKYSTETVNRPDGAKDINWFRDWFFPLWIEGGRSAETMKRYFGLLAQYFPTRLENGGRNSIYDRRMNAGEYVLFTSAAAGVDLSPRAAEVFEKGFSRVEFDKARRDFPEVTFPEVRCTVGSMPCSVVEVAPVTTQYLRKADTTALKIKAVGDDLAFTATGLPAGVEIDRRTGVISGKPTEATSGYAQVTVTGRDANPGQASFRWEFVDWSGKIRNTSNDCLDNNTSSTKVDNPVQAWGCNDSLAQLVVMLDGQLTVQGQCIVPLRASGAGESPVVTNSCEQKPDEKWTVDPNNDTIHHTSSDRCLTSNGTMQLTVTACTKADSQKWTTPVSGPQPEPTPAEEACTPGSTPCDAIKVTPVDTQYLPKSNPVTIKIEARGKGLTFAATGLPVGVEIDRRTGVISGTPTGSGSGSAEVTVSGEGASSGQASFRWNLVDWSGKVRGTPNDCLDNNSSSTRADNPVQAWECNDSEAQLVSMVDGQLTVQGQCIVPLRASGAGESPVVTNSCEQKPDEKWTVDPNNGTIRHTSSDRCLTNNGDTEQLTVTACTKADSQKWTTPA